MGDQDSSARNELRIIGNMLRQARAEDSGLEVAVIWTFAAELRSGEKDYGKAAANALAEYGI